jgi:hypothetical protein
VASSEEERVDIEAEIGQAPNLLSSQVASTQAKSTRRSKIKGQSALSTFKAKLKVLTKKEQAIDTI